MKFDDALRRVRDQYPDLYVLCGYEFKDSWVFTLYDDIEPNNQLFGFLKVIVNDDDILFFDELDYLYGWNGKPHPEDADLLIECLKRVVYIDRKMNELTVRGNRSLALV